MLEESLHNRLFKKPEMAATRDGFGTGVIEAGRADERVVVLSADLKESTRAEGFAEEFPERFIEVGVAEQNMATVAAGMAGYGKLPFITSYAAFSPGRNWEQIRTTAALNNVPVVVCGMHAGVSVGPDGATHQMLEDLALMRAMPNMTVISPCDAHEGHKATLAVARLGKPAYLRFAREKTPVMTTSTTPFEIGKAHVMWEPDERPEVVIFGTGPILYQALLAAQELQYELPVMVVNVHTIKPIDAATIVSSAKQAGAAVTVEEHQVAGGLGSAVAEVLAESAPTPIEFVGVCNRFGQSGTPEELYREYGLDTSAVIAAIKRAHARKKR